MSGHPSARDPFLSLPYAETLGRFVLWLTPEPRPALSIPRLVLQLGLSTLDDFPLAGIGSPVVRVARVHLDSLHIARLPLREFDAGVVNFDNLRLGIDLILGINAFDGYRLQFDFTQGRLYLLAM